MNKSVIIVTVVITIITLIAVGVLLFVSAREPSVEIVGDELRISGLYGTVVSFDEISGVTLLEQSMADIGAGSRTNGSNFRVWRGHFDAGLLFVHPNISPTLRVERAGAPPVFISHSDAAQTRALYNQLTARLN